jgi:hypothetical protein
LPGLSKFAETTIAERSGCALHQVASRAPKLAGRGGNAKRERQPKSPFPAQNVSRGHSGCYL